MWPLDKGLQKTQEVWAEAPLPRQRRGISRTPQEFQDESLSSKGHGSPKTSLSALLVLWDSVCRPLGSRSGLQMYLAVMREAATVASGEAGAGLPAQQTRPPRSQRSCPWPGSQARSHLPSEAASSGEPEDRTWGCRKGRAPSLFCLSSCVAWGKSHPLPCPMPGVAVRAERGNGEGEPEAT